MLRQTVRRVKPQLAEEHPSGPAGKRPRKNADGRSGKSFEESHLKTACRKTTAGWKTGKHGTPGNERQVQTRNLSQ
ncbi:MAG: hypothetical protein EGQ81_03210 [Akkermansia sp.]|nr:hypothetical protein [Akkermansia sp.]